MSCYYYRVIIEQVTIKEGFIQATSSTGAVDRFQKEILPSLDHYTSVEFKEMNCKDCNSTDDVAAFMLADKQMILCQSCRLELFSKKKAASAGTLTA